RLRENLRQIQPQLIHAGPVQGGGFLAALSGFHPLLVMSWGSDVLVDADRSASLRWMTRFTLSRADMVFGDCRAVQNRAVSLSSLKPDQFVLFPWGVELTLFRPRPSDLQLRSKLGWDTNVVLLATRGFQPIHAPLVLLEAFRHTLQSNPHARLIFVGTGSLRPQVDAFIKDYALSDKVYLPGQVLHPSLVDYFNEADIYVSSTMSDGSSISMLEAMACGRPVIVTDGFGNPEWVKPGQNGWLYPAGDA